MNNPLQEFAHNYFAWARIKLTAIYLVIIMIVSILFSAVIYRGIVSELNSRFVAIENRFVVRDVERALQIHETLLTDLRESKRRVLYILLYTDGVIFLVSAIAGYIMAGQTLKPIEDAVNEQKRFVADASHELKTPITALKTQIEVALRAKKNTKKQIEATFLSNLEQIQKLEDLTNGLLSMARLTQHEEVTFQKTDVSQVAEDVYKKFLPIAKHSGIALRLENKKVEILADRDSIEKLLSIFVDNAIKYTPKGEVVLRVKTFRREVLFEISDTGIGIEKEDIPRIFDRFYRADKSRSKIKVSGFGLGLALAEQIVSRHNGNIQVASSIGTGTTFKIYIPR